MTLTVTRKHLSIFAALAVATTAGVLLLVNQPKPALAQQPDADKTPAPKPAEPPAPEAKDKPAPEPTARQPEPSPSLSATDANEYTPQTLPGAVSIPMLTGPELVVVPTDSNKARAEQVEWQYIPIFRLDEVKYDGERKLLTCRIDPRLSAQTRDRVFAHLREQTNAPLQTAFRLNPVRLQSLTVELSLPENKKFVLREDRAGHDITSGPIAILFRVKDDDVHDLLSANLRDLTLTVRTTHPYSAIIRHTASVESSLTAARQAFEKVLPKGMKLEDLEKHPLIVDRDTALKLQQVLREEFRAKYDGDPAKLAALMPALEKVLTRIGVSEVPLYQVTNEMINRAVIWNSQVAEVDVSGSQRTTMTKELEEATEKRTAFKEAWDTMREEAKKAGNAEDWHNTLYTKSKGGGSLDVGVKVFKATASLNFEKEYSKSDEGSQQASNEHYEKMKRAGEMSEEAFEKSYRKFKGEDWAKSSAGKILNLRRLTNLNSNSFRSAIIEVVERQGKGMLERVTLLPLVAGDTQQADALREIDLIKKKLAALRADQKQRDIDELGTMKSWFSDKLPKGYVWADGLVKFPNEEWVPSPLRGKPVPDMRGELLGGARSPDDVGRINREGVIVWQKQEIEGKNFKLPDAVKTSLTHEEGDKKDEPAKVLVNNRTDVKTYVAYGDGGNARMSNASVLVPKEGTPLRGVATIDEQQIKLDSSATNPRHVMCRWIIKVSVEE